MLSGNDNMIDNIHWYTYIYIDNSINRIMLLLQIKIQIVTQVYLYICIYSHI